MNGDNYVGYGILCLTLLALTLAVVSTIYYYYTNYVPAREYCTSRGYDGINSGLTYCVSCTENAVGAEFCFPDYKIPENEAPR